MLVLSSGLVVLSGAYFLFKDKKSFIIVTFLILTLLAALRSYTVGPDGNVYANYFEMLKEMELSEIPIYFTKEPVFYIVTKYIQKLGFGLQGWYAIIGGVYALAVCIIVYRYSEHSFISILSLFSLGYFIFSFTGLRQTVALSIILFSAVALEKKRYVMFVVLVFLATVFHNSAIIFLIMIFIRDKKISARQYLLLLASGFLMVRVFSGQIYALLNQLLEDSERFRGYSNYTYGLSWAGVVIQGAILVFCIYFMDSETLKKNRLFLNVSFVGVFFQMCVVLVAEMFRVSMYFSVFNIVLVANVCMGNRFTKDSKGVVIFLILASVILYFINGHIGYQYSFYWQ